MGGGGMGEKYKNTVFSIFNYYIYFNSFSKDIPTRKIKICPKVDNRNMVPVYFMMDANSVSQFHTNTHN